MSAKRQRKYRAIQHLGDGIKAYVLINAILEAQPDDLHPHIKQAQFIAKATLNELLDLYLEKNGEQQLEALAAEINNTGSNDMQDGVPPVPSV